MTLPIAFHVQDRHCLVIGDSAEAIRRVTDLIELGARVSWVQASEASSADVGESLTLTPRTKHPLTIVRGSFESAQLEGAWLVVFADKNEALARTVFAECEARQILCCAIDQPTHSNFSHMALVRAEPVVVAISTAGQAPALARKLQQELRKLLLPERVGTYFRAIATLRRETPESERRATLERALERLVIEGHINVPEVNTPVHASKSI
jgi:siroheme synthase-like protein